MLDVYGLKQCGTTRKALRYLDTHGLPYRFRDVREDPPARSTLRRALSGSIPLRRFFNTSGKAYREGGFKDRVPIMNREEALDALDDDPMLLKRPLVVGPGVLLVGFREETYDRELTNAA